MRWRQDSSTTKSVTGSRSTDTARRSKKSSEASKKRFPRKCAKIRRSVPSKGVEKTELRFVSYSADGGTYTRAAFLREVSLFLQQQSGSMQNTVLPAPPQLCPRAFKPCQRSCLKPTIRRSASLISLQRRDIGICRRQRRASESELETRCQMQPSVREGGILLVKDAKRLGKTLGLHPVEQKKDVKVADGKQKEEEKKMVAKEDLKEKKAEVIQKTEKKPETVSEKKQKKIDSKSEKKEEKTVAKNEKKIEINEVKKTEVKEVVILDEKRERKEAVKEQASEKKAEKREEKKEESKPEKKKDQLKPDCHHERGCDNAYAIRTSIPLVEKLIERMAEVNQRRKNRHLAAIQLTAERILTDAVNALYNGGEIGDTVVERITRVSAMARAVLKEPQDAISDVSNASSSNVNACSKLGDSSKSRR